IPIEAKYFDRKGRLARVLTWDEVKDLGGRRIPSHMTLVPQDKEGQKTEMDYLEIEFDVDVPDSMFSLSELEAQR
ncbi:MAG: outer membrane lipoprotein-sorting protein, partial [Candidatus Hydrogenedentes bacterium]|nr:outer membrane lipoprotein-sorting protein [Candidatus Hydrogenedentota bacterium]